MPLTAARCRQIRRVPPLGSAGGHRGRDGGDDRSRCDPLHIISLPPLVDKKGYSFTALKGTEDVVSADKGFNAKAAPTSFVIDRTGRIISSE